MPSVVLYFQIHQPYRLRRYSVFETRPDYFDDAKNAEICRKVADKCYRPATRLLLDMVRRHEGRFRLSLSITGSAMEQLEANAPDVIQLLRDLAATGCCELLSETYFHSLASFHSREEFVDQIEMHARKLNQLFGVTPAVFRNTELIYANELASFLSGMKRDDGRSRFLGCLSEGTDLHLANRSPNVLYRPPSGVAGTPADGGRPFALLLKNYRLSDDIAFRFSNRSWSEYPLTADKFAKWVDDLNAQGAQVCNLFMDYETFGEHQWADTGIFDFLARLPAAILAASKGRNDFLTPTEAIRRFDATLEYDIKNPISWADTERDASAWRGNQMQAGALDELYRIEHQVKDRYAQAIASADAERRHEAWQILTDWRRLTTSDHFYYMSTKHLADGEVHKYFSPYESPYDAYINFMNVLDNLKSRLNRRD